MVGKTELGLGHSGKTCRRVCIAFIHPHEKCRVHLLRFTTKRAGVTVVQVILTTVLV